MRLIAIWALLIRVTLNIGADPSETLRQLEETVIPEADIVDLARRFNAVDVDSIHVVVRVYQIGDQDTFYVSNTDANTMSKITARLVAMGDHAYIWVEGGGDFPQSDLDWLTRSFDTQVYEPTRELWGSEASPGVDGDLRIHILFSTGLSPGTVAYFARRHSFPAAVANRSSQRELMIVNLEHFRDDLVRDDLISVLGHEFQHMIAHNLDSNEDSWLNEGMSTFTEYYLGFGTSAGAADAFFANPSTQLNSFGLFAVGIADYGAGFTFLTYFYERLGLEALQMLSSDPANGLVAVDDVLREFGQPDVDTFFADWVLANLLQDPSLTAEGYGYESLDGTTSASVRKGSVSMGNVLPQYATDYYVFDEVADVGSLQISLDLPETTSLVSVDTDGSNTLWYSNRGDVSNMRLTQAFDLTEVEQATLNFRTWYEIEEGWDYAYVTVSSDGGEHWDVLSGNHTTTYDPQANAYGPGYTGYSDGWVEEYISLNDYTGRPILLRFEQITDDAVNEAGMVIDDVSIPEIGYSSDFEIDSGGWQSEGWILTNNLLPQDAWVQVIYNNADGQFDVQRWRASEGSSWQLDLNPETRLVVVAVSPFASVTTIPAVYTLNVEEISPAN